MLRDKIIMDSLKVMRKIIPLALFLFISGIMIFPRRSIAEESKTEYINDEYGLGLILGNTYDPVHNINFYMLSGISLYDYEKIWHHRAPDPLRFKLEYNIGMAREYRTRFMTSINMFALYYLDMFEYDEVTPYVEGGIGVIYTDFHVKGQGLKINFNPQMGMGAEFKTESRTIYFISIRLHHISNGGINKDNRGVNSGLLIIGRFF